MKNETLRKEIHVDRPNHLSVYTFKENDNAVLKLSLFKNSTAFDITGQTLTLGAKTSKGLIEQIDGFTINENELDIELKNSILVPEIVEIDLNLRDADGAMTTASFFIKVNSKVLNDSAVEATNEFDLLSKTVANIEEDYNSLRGGLLAEDKVVYFQDEINKANASLEHNTNDITTLKKDIGTTANIEELKTVNNEATQKISELDEKLTQVGDISETIVNVENSKTDYFGEEHLTVDERLNEDFDKLWQFNNESQLLEYTGTNITADNTYYGLTKDLSIKGRTLQNLNQYFKEVISRKLDFYYVDYKVCDTTRLVAGKTYTVIYNLNIKEDTANGKYNHAEFGIGTVGFEQTVDNYKKHSVKNGLNKLVITFNPSSPLSYNYLYIRPIRIGTTPVEGEYVVFDITNFTILEGDYTNTPISEIPFIEGIESTGEKDVIDGKYPVRVRSCGKNLFDINDCYNSTIEGNIVSTKSLVPIYHKKLVIGKKYNFSALLTCEVPASNSLQYSLSRTSKWDITYSYAHSLGNATDKKIVWTFTALSEDFYILSGAGKTIDPLWKMWNIQLEEATTATGYEPYKETSIEYLLDEPLRSLPNGTCDEIVGNKLIKRIGKVVLDGSEDWYSVKSINGVDKYFGVEYLAQNMRKSTDLNNQLCDNMIIKNPYQYPNDSCLWVLWQTKSIIRITINGIQSIDGIKQWLQANPTTVYYELSEPISTELDKSIVLNTFDGTTHITSDNYLLPNLTVKVPSNVQAVVTNLMSENKSLNYELESTKQELETNINVLNDMDAELISTNWDMDYRVCEIEWTLEDIAGATPVALTIGNTGGISNMALSRYEQAKIMILGGKYDKETLTKQLTTYLNRGYVAQEEYDELIALMEARELVIS